MTTPLALVLGFVEDPRFGLPMLLLLEATVFWTASIPRPAPLVGALRRSWTRPSGDAVSRMFYALDDRRYSVVVRWSRERIEELYKARAGVPLPSAPFEWSAREDLPANRFELRRVARALSAFEWEAREREAGLHTRWAFWRSRRRDASGYRGRVQRLLAEAQARIAELEAGP